MSYVLDRALATSAHALLGAACGSSFPMAPAMVRTTGYGAKSGPAIRTAMVVLALAACGSNAATPVADSPPLAMGDAIVMANADVYSTINDVLVIGFPNAEALASCTVDSASVTRYCTFDGAAVRATARVTLLDAVGTAQLAYDPSTTRVIDIQASLLLESINILPYASGLVGQYSAATLHYVGQQVGQSTAWSWNGTRSDSLLIGGSSVYYMVRFTTQLRNVVTMRTFSNAAANDSSVYAPISGTIRRSATVVSYLVTSTQPKPFESVLTFNGTLTPGLVLSGFPFKEDIYSAVLIKLTTP